MTVLYHMQWIWMLLYRYLFKILIIKNFGLGNFYTIYVDVDGILLGIGLVKISVYCSLNNCYFIWIHVYVQYNLCQKLCEVLTAYYFTSAYNMPLLNDWLML